MRCREARRRIAELPKDRLEQSSGRELLTHLHQCQACAAEAHTVGMMRTVLAEAGRVDPQVIINQDEMRQKVEQRLGDRQQSRSASGARQLVRILPVGSLATAAVVLIMLNTYVPTEPSAVLGYQVALVGVDQELALNDEIICDMLHRLGLDEAAVDIMGCEITCDLLIYDLKSREEAQLVAAAFDVMDGDNVTTDVIELVEPVPSS